MCGYNVTTMNTITAKLVKDGNSIAIRLPKVVLELSGLHDTVGLVAKKGQIVVSQAKKARADWPLKMQELIATNAKIAKNDEFRDWDNTLSDGLDG
jgi:antitoxin component of MazEF toxin-antitoxin module